MRPKDSLPKDSLPKGSLPPPESYRVVHPLDDAPEEKRSVDKLGPMKLTRSVRLSLFVLRDYLVLMGLLVLSRILRFWK